MLIPSRGRYVETGNGLIMDHYIREGADEDVCGPQYFVGARGHTPTTSYREKAKKRC